MGMTSAMQDVFYDNKDFNHDVSEGRHPLWMTERHFCYHLAKDRYGDLACIKDSSGRRLRSPRLLSEICVYSLVCSDGKVLHQTKNQYFPSNLYPIMLSEALYQREARAIEWLISTWPMRVLRIIDVIPLEDDLDPEYFTLPIEGNEDTCLVDYIILGLLKMKPEAGLKTISFRGFEKDRKLCRELCRLPFLWMKPSERTIENIHDRVSDVLDVSKDKVRRFLNRIDVVYSNIEKEFPCGRKMNTIRIELDLQVTLDDVPFGLTFQRCSPFRFLCQRLWVKHIPEADLPLNRLEKTLEVGRITHFECNDPMLTKDPQLCSNLCECLGTLHNLTALSLPNSLDIQAHPDMIRSINGALRRLPHLQRLDVSYSNLREGLDKLLEGLRQRLAYLSLRDCRLSEQDLLFLVGWRPLASLRELNLSCNVLDQGEQAILAMLERMSRLTCFSVRNCQLSVHSLVLVARACKECSFLKVLCLHGYTPLSRENTLELLSIAAQIRSLQKVLVFPDGYAFPGHNEVERRLNKEHMMRFCYRYLAIKGRRDLRLG